MTDHDDIDGALTDALLNADAPGDPDVRRLRNRVVKTIGHRRLLAGAIPVAAAIAGAAVALAPAILRPDQTGAALGGVMSALEHEPGTLGVGLALALAPLLIVLDRTFGR